MIQTDVTTGETSKNSTDVDSHTTTAVSISAAPTNSTAPAMYTTPYAKYDTVELTLVSYVVVMLIVHLLFL